MTIVITSPDGALAISNLGWVDKGSLWCYDSKSGASTTVQLADGDYVAVSRSRDPDRFLAFVPLEEGAGLRIAVFDWRDLSAPLAVGTEVLGRMRYEGDASALEAIGACFVARARAMDDADHGYDLLRVDGDEVHRQRIGWFDDRYDHVYQSVLSALELPDGRLLFGVQRSSELVVCESQTLREIGTVPLSDGEGNPLPFLRDGGNEIWAIDYDTLVVLEGGSLRVTGSWRMQPGVPSHELWADSPWPDQESRQFVGGAWMAGDESVILVPRPFSGDVLAFDPECREVVRSWRTGGQPLEAAVVGGRLVARDWRSGELLLADD